MMWGRPVAADVWLGFARSAASGGATARQHWWVRDREAADRAVTAVLLASGYRREACVTSRSHTRGVAAAVAAPLGSMVGVDLVSMDRVGPKHARAILTEEEWDGLAPYAAIRPPLAWALKEAAAKAAGDPLRRFPHGLRIGLNDRGLTVTTVDVATLTFAADWIVYDGLLCAWLRGKPSIQVREPSP
jgi:phosphopantetheinyl transferase (holo-ACP synthase)